MEGQKSFFTPYEAAQRDMSDAGLKVPGAEDELFDGEVYVEDVLGATPPSAELLAEEQGVADGQLAFDIESQPDLEESAR